MAGLTATIDPDGAALPLTPAYGFDVIGLSAPHADDEVQRVGSISTEGERSAGSRPSNQPLTVRLRITGRGDTAEARLTSFAAAQRALDQKVIKLRREGGVLRLGFPGLDTIDWDVVEVTGGDRLLDNRFMRRYRTEDEITFVCLPGGRGREREVPLTLARDTPCLITEPFAVAGDMEAFGRLRLRNETDRDVRWLRWGREARHLSTEPTAELHYDAVDLTPLGAARVVDGVIRQSALAPGWLALLSTDVVGIGPLTHTGVFEVRARIRMPTTNVGEVQVAWEWWAGDGTTRTVNTPLVFAADHAREGQLVQVDLGEVYIGAQSRTWTGRLLARSTVVGDDLDVRDIELVPLAEGNGTLLAISQATAATTAAAVDGFEHPAGVLAGNVAPIGGPWVEGGATGAFQVGSRYVTRTTVAPQIFLPNFHRATLADVNVANTELSLTVSLDYPQAVAGITQACAIVRYVDDSNFVYVGISSFRNSGGEWHTYFAYQVIGGVAEPLSWGFGGQMAGVYYGTRQFRFVVIDNLLTMYADGQRVLIAQSAAMLPGGALESGSVGLFDASTRPRTRSYSALFASTGGQSRDAVAFPNKQVELRHDGVDREASDGSAWGRVADVSRDYLRLSPAGVEGRRNRLIAIPCETDPESAPDAASGRLSATLHVTPRYRTIPDLA